MSKEAGDEWQAPIGRGSGSQGWSPLQSLQVRL